MTPRGSSGGRSRSGFTFADVLLVLAVAGLLLSLAWPRFRRARFEHRVSHAIHDVDALRTAAREYEREHGGTWPPGSPGGGIPSELAAMLGDGTHVAAGEYQLDWDRWDRLQRASGENREPPDTSASHIPVVGFFGSITLRSGDGGLLAELVRHYGPSSFALDSSWTLVVLPDTVSFPAPASGQEGLGSGSGAHID